MKTELIIAFTEKTTKFLPRIFCRRFRHCCVLFPFAGNKYALVQIGIDGVRVIPVDARAIRRLERAGWVIVRSKSAGQRAQVKRCDVMHQCPVPSAQFLTCVGFAKRTLGIRDPFIWTPDGLYRHLTLGTGNNN